MNNYT